MYGLRSRMYSEVDTEDLPGDTGFWKWREGVGGGGDQVSVKY